MKVTKWKDKSIFFNLDEYQQLIQDINNNTAIDNGKCPRYYKLVYKRIESRNTIREANNDWENFVAWDMCLQDLNGKNASKPRWLKLKPNDELIQPLMNLK